MAHRYKVVDIEDENGEEGCAALEYALDLWGDYDLVTIVRRTGHTLRLVLKES